jgi:hypothetical protein
VKILYYIIQYVGVLLLVVVLSMLLDDELIYPYFSIITAILLITMGMLGVNNIKSKKHGVYMYSLGVISIAFSIQQLTLAVEKYALLEQNYLWEAIVISIISYIVGMFIIHKSKLGIKGELEQ